MAKAYTMMQPSSRTASADQAIIQMTQRLMNNELEEMRKEAVVTHLVNVSRCFPEGTEGNYEKSLGFEPETPK
jgi:hypothetical protein